MIGTRTLLTLLILLGHCMTLCLCTFESETVAAVAGAPASEPSHACGEPDSHAIEVGHTEAATCEGDCVCDQPKSSYDRTLKAVPPAMLTGDLLPTLLVFSPQGRGQAVSPHPRVARVSVSQHFPLLI